MTRAHPAVLVGRDRANGIAGAHETHDLGSATLIRF
jgi:hypothetical protein